MDMPFDDAGTQPRTWPARLKQRLARRQDLLINCGLILFIAAIALLSL